jgi:hypothetical protein
VPRHQEVEKPSNRGQLLLDAGLREALSDLFDLRGQRLTPTKQHHAISIAKW